MLITQNLNKSRIIFMLLRYIYSKTRHSVNCDFDFTKGLRIVG